MRSASIPFWQAALARWGDPVFELALLLTDDRAAAEQRTVAVLAQSLAGDSATLELRLYGALLRPQRWPQLEVRRWLPVRFQRHGLPQPLARVAPRDRVLLGLWLLQGVDGARLGQLAGSDLPGVARRIAAALLTLAGQPAGVDSSQQSAFETWLIEQLQPPHAWRATPSDDPQTGYSHASAWQALVEAARTTLRSAVGNQHVPLHTLDAAAAELLEQSDTPTWWQQRPVWLSVLLAAVVGLLVLLLAPWRGDEGATSTAQATPHELVQQTLAAWTAEPDTGAVQRRVWARDPRSGEESVTDLWIADGSAQHRVEVRHGATLVEWQLGDGRARFEYAAHANHSSCRWAEPSALDQLVRAFKLPPEQQQLVRDTRLTLGALGEGYRLMQQAVTAPDLRSFGRRVVGDTALVALAYTDKAAANNRRLLIWIEPRTATLHLIQDLSGGAATSTSRDLWRLVQNDAVPSVPMKRPEWDRSTQTRDSLLDPACPGLDSSHVLSLRQMISGSAWWGQNYLPAELPHGTTAAAVLSAHRVADLSNISGDVRTIFIGPGRWLSVGLVLQRADMLRGGTRHSSWEVALREEGQYLMGTACRIRQDLGRCLPLLRISARGWSQDELLATVNTVQAVDEATWLAFADAFLEPQPLSADVRAVIERVVTAQQVEPAQGLHTRALWRARVDPQRPVAADPYHLPLALLEPEQLVQEQWLAQAGSAQGHYKNQYILPDGDLYSMLVVDGDTQRQYTLREGVARSEAAPPDALWAVPPLTPASEVMRALLRSTAPIHSTNADGAVVLEQEIQHYTSPRLQASGLLAGPLKAWLDDLPLGRVVQRVWLDAATYQLQLASTVHIDEQSRETELSALELLHQRSVDPRTVAWTLPQLPADVVRLERTGNVVRVRGAAVEWGAMTRALVWPACPDLIVVRDKNQVGVGRVFAEGNDLRLEPALFTPLGQLESLELLKVTTYALPNQKLELTIRQGPRNLLRHVLRHVQSNVDSSAAPRFSRQLEVTIAGKPYGAWLLGESADAVLVVEVDELLLHIAGAPPEYLATELVAQLAQLEWTALEQ